MRVPIRDHMKTKRQYRKVFYRYDNFTFHFKSKTVETPFPRNPRVENQDIFWPQPTSFLRVSLSLMANFFVIAHLIYQ